ncbi:MAG: DNA-3-methyladenine glycosylase II [Maribacter sp.]
MTSIKGVGVWTVEMILMFSLNRPDIFPKGDLGIQNGMKQLYQLENLEKKTLLKEMGKIAEQWKPYRTFASKYIWAAKDQL